MSQIIAVEHDPNWRDRIAPLVLNGIVVLRPTEDKYIEEACNEHGEFDIVIIDGERREECAPYAARASSPKGCIVWDDSQEEHFKRGYPTLRKQGWREITFWGLKPSAIVPGQCSLLYRDGNCLGI